MLKGTLNIIVIIIIFILAIIFFNLMNKNVTYVRSDVNAERYLVRDDENKQAAADMLGSIWTDMCKLRDHLYKNKKQNKVMEKHIEQLNRRMQNSVISESDINSVYTSYTVNKGEEIVFCIRSRANGTRGDIHDKNLLMYVAIHEMAHVGCPEEGHTPLFTRIFEFFASEAVKIGIYKYDDYYENPVEYCGMNVTDTVLRK